jgi:hypothetical protein
VDIIIIHHYLFPLFFEVKKMIFCGFDFVALQPYQGNSKGADPYLGVLALINF